MLFYYIRHGDPTYEPDALTPLGERQAEAIAKRLSHYGIDKIYSSTSNRAIMTAKPTCEILKKDMTLLEFCHEDLTSVDFGITENGKWRWPGDNNDLRRIFDSDEVLSLGQNWFEHPRLSHMKAGVDRIYKESYEFFKSLGYEHIGNTGKYKVLWDNPERVALFAHHRFGIAFFSCMLGIPYPVMSNLFSMCHTGMTVVDFRNEDGIAVPVVLSWSSDGHIYKEGLPTHYNREIYF